MVVFFYQHKGGNLEIMKIKNWLNVTFESSCYKTPQFMTFVTDFSKHMRSVFKGKVKGIKFSVGHFYISGFIEKLDGTFVYFSTSDVRHFPGEWYHHILYRSAKSLTDCTGGSNHFTSLDKLVEAALSEQL